MWTAGVAGGAALIALWRIVGPGFLWLSAGVGVLLGAAAWAAGGGTAAAIGTVALVAAGVAARRPQLAAGAFAVSAVGFLIVAATRGTLVGALTGALALGGVTDEMLLGHWYLVDPRLPRRPLRRLAGAALVGVVLDAVLVAGRGGIPWSAGATAVGWAWVALSTTSLLLVVAVWFALREPAYSAVMAATGLSYLAVLTVIAASVAGRSLFAENLGLLALGRLPWL
jgi:hypothetical protein